MQQKKQQCLPIQDLIKVLLNHRQGLVAGAQDAHVLGHVSGGLRPPNPAALLVRCTGRYWKDQFWGFVD